MKSILLLFLLSFLVVSCNVNPTFVARPDGTVVASTGGSIFSNSTTEGGEIKMPNGTTISYFKTGKDETKGVNSAINSYNLLRGTVALSKDALSGLRTTEGTKRVLNNNATAVKQSEIAADVTKATFVPEEVPAVAPP